jgi:hypothetical protein
LQKQTHWSASGSSYRVQCYRRRQSAAAAGAALLTWRTASEINSDHFEIEKSNTGKDWQKIGSIPAKNPGAENVEYSLCLIRDAGSRDGLLPSENGG